MTLSLIHSLTQNKKDKKQKQKETMNKKKMKINNKNKYNNITRIRIITREVII